MFPQIEDDTNIYINEEENYFTAKIEEIIDEKSVLAEEEEITLSYNDDVTVRSRNSVSTSSHDVIADGDGGGQQQQSIQLLFQQLFDTVNNALKS